jgi:hypothetical protein
MTGETLARWEFFPLIWNVPISMKVVWPGRGFEGGEVEGERLARNRDRW